MSQTCTSCYATVWINTALAERKTILFIGAWILQNHWEKSKSKQTKNDTLTANKIQIRETDAFQETKCNHDYSRFSSGQLNYCTALSLFDYIHQEREYLPWKTAIDGISSVGTALTKTKLAKKYFKV